MKAYGGVALQLHAFLISVLDEVSGQFHSAVVLPQGKSLQYPLDLGAGTAQSV
jgi:hypothetical protein